ncbi:hypothetical protein ACVTNF_003503 [Photobacterium damselae]
MKTIYFLLLLTSTSIFGHNISSVDFDVGVIRVFYEGKKPQLIKAEIYPNEIDYNYYLYDINFDGNKDLLVYESGIGPRGGYIDIYLYNIELDALDEFYIYPYSRIESFRINQDKSSICLISNDFIEFINIKNKVKYFMDNNLFYMDDGKTKEINKHQYESKVTDCTQFEDIVPVKDDVNIEANNVIELSSPYENIFFAGNLVSANNCGDLYYFDSNNKKIKIVKDSNDEIPSFCIFNQNGKELLSRERISASEYIESIWEIIDNKLILKTLDRLKGSHAIERKEKDEVFLVNKDEDIHKRKRLKAKVLVNKSFFYDKSFNKRKSYVIKGDVLEPMKYSNNSDYIFVRYGETFGFIKSNELSLY